MKSQIINERGKMLKRSLFYILFLAAAALADKVYLINGDIVSGQIITAENGKLIVDSQLMGKVEIDLSKVKTFESEQALPLHLSDGSLLNQRAIAAEDGTIRTESQTLSAQTLDIDDIAAINPPEPEKPRWKGTLNAGLFYSSGNTRKDSYNIGFSFKKDSEEDRISFRGDTIKSREEQAGEKEVTEDWWKLNGKYDYFISDRTYLYANSEYKKDDIANLDRRVIIGGGLGRQFIDQSDVMTLDGEIGLASVYEKYEGQESENEMSLRLAYNLFKRLANKLVFNHGLEYYPQTSDMSDYYLSTFGEFKFDVTSTVFSSYKVIFDYDPTPAQGSGSTDVKHLLSLGVKF
jgi:putative salt-induced outer membrane protein YdiY